QTSCSRSRSIGKPQPAQEETLNGARTQEVDPCGSAGRRLGSVRCGGLCLLRSRWPSARRDGNHPKSLAAHARRSSGRDRRSPDGVVLYAALNLENAVAFIDTATGQVRARVRLAPAASADGIGPLPYALVQAGEKLYVSEWNGGGVAVIDIGQQQLLQRIPTGGHASGLALSPDRKRLYVAHPTSATVSLLDTST